jgi:hypothetical protein
VNVIPLDFLATAPLSLKKRDYLDPAEYRWRALAARRIKDGAMASARRKGKRLV